MSKQTILAINPGSTSTKIAVYEGRNPILVRNIDHSNEQLAQYPEITDQFDFRKKEILDTLAGEGILLSQIEVIVGRGGLVHPLESGVYRVNEAMKQDLRNSPVGTHASNLGGLIADDLAATIGSGVKAYIADPVVVDEMEDVARITGLPQIRRRSIFHALNQKAVARNYAEQKGLKYEQINVIVAHLGGGISVGAHRQGRVIDVNNALDGEGPFSPERSGSLPVGDFLTLATGGEFTLPQIRKMVKGEGGMVALLGSNSARDADDRIEAGDPWALEVVNAMSYNIGKSIGAMATVLEGKVDAIIITGGIARSKFVIDYTRRMVEFIAPVVVFPGEDEMSALALNGLMVLTGELTAKEY